MDNQTQFKIGYNPLICDKYDWRIKYVCNLESELKKIPGNDDTFDWEVGSPCFLTQPLKIDKDKIDLTLPEMSAIYLNTSNQNFQFAINIFNNLDKKKIKGYIHLDMVAFDYFEKMTVSIVFAVSALEVFFNQLLLGKDKKTIFLTKLNKEDGSTRDLRREDIEWLSLEEKYFEVMPIMFQLDKGKLEKIRSKFIELNKIRNDIVHLKSGDLEPQTDFNRNSIWKKIFIQAKKNPAIISVEIIKFFYQESGLEMPRFLRLLPFK